MSETKLEQLENELAETMSAAAATAIQIRARWGEITTTKGSLQEALDASNEQDMAAATGRLAALRELQKASALDEKRRQHQIQKLRTEIDRATRAVIQIDVAIERERAVLASGAFERERMKARRELTRLDMAEKSHEVELDRLLAWRASLVSDDQSFVLPRVKPRAALLRHYSGHVTHAGHRVEV